ncbi:uncharacterized protein LOC143033002 [Oratosquilla oratoria]|uniref:uncharacterized protein LOC143033002 n=1 Tax=Oratosquilla oratoria TaxID=337810 RepID=UPI003F77665E
MAGPLPYDDQDLLQHLRTRYLVPPSTRPYNLTKNTKPHSTYNNYRRFDLPWIFYRRVLQEVFTDGGISEGERFFVEAGALDGEFLSNTLYLEEELGWTGLLVEPDNDMFLLLQKKHRHAWSTHACLSGTPYPYSTVFVKYIASMEEIPGTEMYARAHGQLQEVEDVYGSTDGGRGSEFEHHRLYEKVQCLPLGSLLLALNITTVDVVSLDLEGAEEGVLSTFPWDQVSVRVWFIENKRAVESPRPPREEDVRLLSDEMTEGKSSGEIASKTKVYLQENRVSGRNEEEVGEIISDQKISDHKLTPAKDFGVRGSGNQRAVLEESVAERESDKSKSCDKSKDDKKFDPVAFFEDKGYSLFATHQLYQNHDHVFVKKEFLVKERKVD